jgi:hypothetical protein
MKSQIIFKEIQKFSKSMLIFIIFITLLTPLLFANGLIQQLWNGIPWGNTPMSNHELIVVTIIINIISLAVLFIFIMTKLITEVRQDGLYIKFFPFHLNYHKINIENVEDIILKQFRPIKYGWGIRLTTKGKAYIVSGNKGVQIIYNNHNQVLIGSQKNEELLKAINSINNK